LKRKKESKQKTKPFKGQTKLRSKGKVFDYTTKEGMNSMMRRLAREAHFKRVGRVRSHLIRKWLMSGLSRAGFNDFQIKYLMGKAIPVSDMTYLQTLQQEIEERYPKAYENYLSLKPNKISTELASRLEVLEHENAQLKRLVSPEDARGIALFRELFSYAESMAKLKRLIETL